MPKTSRDAAEGVQSVVLTLRIIEYLSSAGEPVGVTALADALDTTKSRIFRHLRTLVQQGYLAQSPASERYQIGPSLVALSRSVAPGRDLISAAGPSIRELREAIGHSCVVGQMEAAGVRIVTTVPGKSEIEIGVKQGSMLTFHSSAQGKIALAFGDESLLNDVLKRPLEAFTPNTIVDPLELREHVRLVRLRGWATAPDEIAIGLNSLAFPIFDAGGVAVGTLAAVNLTQFIPARPEPNLIREVGDAARRISNALGYVGKPPGA
ncbi:IclR family transcriptional regulator [Hyphomicrobiales bacterium]|nr:IclR family transcriptional regulator [Hyphomicrobiales bacterium]CAH1675512.1 IclR family transcriptional regulator [Hyphomicrobiales bacterium]